MSSAPRLYIRKRARADIAAAFRWHEARSTGLGHEFLRAVRVALASIERAPEQHQLAVDDIRLLPLSRFPYVVYYVVLKRGRVSVLAVTHGRRHPKRWQSRR